MIEQKIAKIVRGIMVEGCCPCKQCQEITVARILALIEQEQKAMREALQEARAEVERLSVVTGYEGEGHFGVLAKIDAVLGGSHE